jgi:hypothetical protein
MRSILPVVIAIGLSALCSSVFAANDGDFGEAVGDLVNNGYMFELATTGRCSKHVTHAHDHRADVQMALSYIPPRLKAQATTALSGEYLEESKREMRLFFQEMQQKMIPTGSADFTCGMTIGMVVNMYANSRRRWSELTGAPPFEFRSK